MTSIIQQLFGAHVVPAPTDPPATEASYQAGPVTDPDTPVVQQLLDTLSQLSAAVVVQKAAPSWQGYHELVGTTVQRIVQANLRRRAVTIVAKGNVAIGPTNDVRYTGAGSNQGSAELWAGDSITMETTGDVWAIAGTADVDVMVFQLLEDG